MTARAQRRASRSTAIDLQEASDEALLAMRLCDLPIQLDDTLMARRVSRLHRELAARNIVALPHVWLSEEFFTPDRVLGFAVPFYLAHKRLMRLERSQMFECEGAGEAECRRILRHEAGHALEEAYRLNSRPRYVELFGNPEDPYPDTYKPRVDSRDHVINLVGLVRPGPPGRGLRRDLRRLAQSLHRLAHRLQRLAGARKARLRRRADARDRRPAAAAVEKDGGRAAILLRHTLKEHYAAKRAHFAWPWPANYDQDLRRIFSDDPKDAAAPPATRYLRRVRGALRTRIADGTGVHAYAVDQLLRQMIARAQSLGLRVIDPPDVTMQKLLVLLTMQTAGLVHAGFPKVAL